MSQPNDSATVDRSDFETELGNLFELEDRIHDAFDACLAGNDRAAYVRRDALIEAFDVVLAFDSVDPNDHWTLADWTERWHSRRAFGVA